MLFWYKFLIELVLLQNLSRIYEWPDPCSDLSSVLCFINGQVIEAIITLRLTRPHGHSKVKLNHRKFIITVSHWSFVARIIFWLIKFLTFWPRICLSWVNGFWKGNIFCFLSYWFGLLDFLLFFSLISWLALVKLFWAELWGLDDDKGIWTLVKLKRNHILRTETFLCFEKKIWILILWFWFFFFWWLFS